MLSGPPIAVAPCAEFQRLARDRGWRIEEHCRLENGTWLSERESPVSYPDETRAALARIEAASFWFRHRHRILAEMLGPVPVLWEVGSGNGFEALRLQEHGMEVIALEPSRAGAQAATARGVRHSVAAFLEELQLPADSLPAVGLFDVLEHLREPETLLNECFRVLRPGGVVAVSVPASPWLWSQADEDAGHFRRYTRRSLHAVLTQCGFGWVRSRYFMLSMWGPMLLLRAMPYRLGRRRPKHENLAASMDQLTLRSGLIAKFVDWILGLERFAGRFLPLPCGTSLAALYRKPESSAK